MSLAQIVSLPPRSSLRQRRAGEQRRHGSDTLRAAFDLVRLELRESGRETVMARLADLEELVHQRVDDLASLTDAVADANARSVEILERQQSLADELRRQNEQLALQNERIAQQRLELEEQLAALANANVDAVLMIDEREQRARKLAVDHEALERDNLELVQRARRLETETMALAESNVLALEMVEQRDARLSQAHTEVRAMKNLNGELEKKALVDELTGLFNHRFFREQLAFEVARAARYERSLSLLFVDVDHFKSLNDVHGHATGNVVLEQLAALLRHEVRGADLPMRAEGSPFAVRYGGEEFVIILPETDVDGARVCAERVRERVAIRKFPGGHTQPSGRLTVSIGVATLRAGDDTNDLVKRADEALYDAKRSGRNRVVVAGA